MEAPLHKSPLHPARLVRSSLFWGLLVLLWAIPGLLCALQVYTNSVLLGDRSYTWAAILWYAMPVWWVWVPATLGILWLGHRFPIERGRRLRGLLVHLPTSLLTALVHLMFYAYWIEVAAPYAATPRPLLERTLRLASDVWLHVDLLAYWAILGGYFALDYYRRFQDREKQTSQLQARLAEAQLHALRMQLHPHFLFNTLNAISTLVLKQDTHTALRMLNRLSDFLRTTLDKTNRQEIPLEEELAFAEQYLAIEQCRFQDRMQVVMEIEPETRAAGVPSLILQPLVENAVRYGIAPQEAGGRLIVRAQRRGARLILQVEDNGPGLPQNTRQSGTGIGLTNTRTRLAQRYRADHTVALENVPSGGVRVTLNLPFQRKNASSLTEQSSLS